MISICNSLTGTKKSSMSTILKSNVDLLMWTVADMPRIHPNIKSHNLTLFKEARPIAQKKRMLSEEKGKTVDIEVKKLLEVGFIREVIYTTWLANVVMVKKVNDQWRMCTNFTDLNKACLKNVYPLPSIDGLVDGVLDYQVLSFLDTYSRYNQILIFRPDSEKTSFITELANSYNDVKVASPASATRSTRSLNSSKDKSVLKGGTYNPTS